MDGEYIAWNISYREAEKPTLTLMNEWIMAAGDFIPTDLQEMLHSNSPDGDEDCAIRDDKDDFSSEEEYSTSNED